MGARRLSSGWGEKSFRGLGQCFQGFGEGLVFLLKIKFGKFGGIWLYLVIPRAGIKIQFRVRVPTFDGRAEWTMR